MQRYFEAHGCEVRLFVNEALDETVPVGDLEALKQFSRSAGLVVYHHSTGWPDVFQELRETRCKKVLKYHNVTPPKFYTGVSPVFERACQVGRAELARLGSVGFDLHLGASAFNVEDLRSSCNCEGRFGVVPPFHQTEELLNEPADSATMKRLKDGFKNIIFVGRVVPNKGHVDLIRAFSHYHHHFNERSRLLIVGSMDPRLESYTSELRKLVSEEDLEGAVKFLGSVPGPVLAAAYQAADLLLACSRHEGFCVPLIEAMAFKVPIVALGAGAVGETVDRAGIVWDDFDPVVFSVSMNRVLSDSKIGAVLENLGMSRYEEEFATEAIENRLATELRRIGVDFG
jgi:glycosyltransferase involved in cell wall biosynthesis